MYDFNICTKVAAGCAPADFLVEYFQGSNLLLLNKAQTNKNW